MKTSFLLTQIGSYNRNYPSARKGHLAMTDESEKKININDDGSVSIDLDRVKRIDIRDIISIASHRIMRDGTGTIHEIKFQNGGHYKLSYTFEGKIRSFTGENIAMNISNENILTLFMNNE